MMDQNRCLLDVINNPELLQSFLESESTAGVQLYNANNQQQQPQQQQQPSNTISRNEAQTIAPVPETTHISSSLSTSTSSSFSSSSSSTDTQQVKLQSTHQLVSTITTVSSEAAQFTPNLQSDDAATPETDVISDIITSATRGIVDEFDQDDVGVSFSATSQFESSETKSRQDVSDTQEDESMIIDETNHRENNENDHTFDAQSSLSPTVSASAVAANTGAQTIQPDQIDTTISVLPQDNAITAPKTATSSPNAITTTTTTTTLNPDPDCQMSTSFAPSPNPSSDLQHGVAPPPISAKIEYTTALEGHLTVADLPNSADRVIGRFDETPSTEAPAETTANIPSFTDTPNKIASVDECAAPTADLSTSVVPTDSGNQDKVTESVQASSDVDPLDQGMKTMSETSVTHSSNSDLSKTSPIAQVSYETPKMLVDEEPTPSTPEATPKNPVMITSPPMMTTSIAPSNLATTDVTTTTATASTASPSFVVATPNPASNTSSTITSAIPTATTTAPTTITTIASPTAVTTSAGTTTAVTLTATTPTTASVPATVAKTTKKAPKRNGTPRASTKGKSSKTSATPPVSTTPSTPGQPVVMQPQYTSQQQVLFQSPTGGIRQPAILTQSPIGQTAIGGMPQQQRVIQIQTANGPMYFAIAPGPAMSNGPMINQQSGMQSQQFPSQQVCFQPNSTVMINRPQLAQNAQQLRPQHPRASTDFIQGNNLTPRSHQPDRPAQFAPDLQQQRCITSPQTIAVSQSQQQQSPQQMRLQSPVGQYNGQPQATEQQTPTSNHLTSVNGLNKTPQPQFTSPQSGPIILQNRSTQGFNQQPQQQVMTSPGSNIIVNGSPMMQSQPRVSGPMMGGQTIAIHNQQNPQQPHMVIPSSQPMMMPRIPGQIILNRPLGGPGQLLPGQQQFIQIQTPNGPMLLALPPQQAQTMQGAPVMNYNSNDMSQQQSPQIRPQQPDTTKGSTATSPAKMTTNSSAKAGASKSGLDLADLLLDCGILPEDRNAPSQSPIGTVVKTSQSPTISQVNSPIPTNMTPMSSSMDTPMPATVTQQPIPSYAGQPMQQQPIRITIGPDGQMIMQPTVYGAIRPMLAGTMGQAHLNTVTSSTNIVSSNSQINPLAPSPSTPGVSPAYSTETSKKTKGKGSETKRNRSRKSDLDKFPILKTPKIAQQKQQQQQQMQAVTVVPMTMILGDQNKVLAGSELKPNVAQLASGQQVSLAKIVTPVMQTASLQPLVSGNIIQTGVHPANMIATTPSRQTDLSQNTPIASDSASATIHQPNAMIGNVTASSTSQVSSSGNVTTNLLHRANNAGTVESNPHISSSLMPTISLSVDTLKVDQGGVKQSDGQNQGVKGPITAGGITTATLVLQPTQLQHPNSLTNQSNQVQQIAPKAVDVRAQSILNQLNADQNAALNPQTKQSFRSLEDACKRLLRYHVFDTETVGEAQLKEVDEVFGAAAESLVTRKKAIYDKFKFLQFKQSMKIVPSSEEVMLEQAFVNDERAFLKKDKELFREYEAHLESMSLSQSRDLDMKKDECSSDYFAFGDKSPKRNHRSDLESAAHSRDVDDWLMADKWGKSHYPSVPDSEAATAIESILNEELS